MNEDLLRKISKIKIIVSDVDGILTDGSIIVSKSTEYKIFHVEDALATSLLKLANIPISFISARKSEATTVRLNELKIENIFQGYINKLSALDKIIDIYNINYKDVLYIGDGFVDIPVMEKVGFSISVPNAHQEVKELADFVTKKSGGQGVLVEIVQHVLKSKGIYDDIFNKMRKHIYEA
tara:strand:- start:1662 stop:2201 length:540 start_codon:yes stop_codon:yes gene_type:complete